MDEGRDVTPPADQSRWGRLKTGHRAVVAVFGVAATVIGLLAALQELGVISIRGEEDALAAAAANTSDAGSATVDLSRTFHTEQGVVEDNAHGAFDFRAEVGFLDHASGLKQRFVKPYLYQQGLAAEGLWCQYDLSVLGQGFLFGAITGFENDPGLALTNLEEHGSYDEVGTETVFGITATHYSGYIELGQLVEQTENPKTRELLEQFSQYNAGRIPLDVWISSDDYVRRLATSFEVPGEEFGLSGRTKVEATFEFSQFGEEVDVKAPSSERVSPAGSNGCPPLP